jgi:putative ABC transport system permease protein
MLRNYFKTAWRSLRKSRFYTSINIVGLCVGLTTGIMLLLWVQSELSYDKFHKDYKNIYQLSSHFNINGEERTWTGVPGPLSVYAKSIPGVQSIVRINREFDQVLSNNAKNKIFGGNTIEFVDSGFLSMFDFHLNAGNKNTVFPNANSVVLTYSTAKKLFGNEEAMGKTIAYDKNNFTVTGVLEDFPENSSLRYDALFPISYYAQKFTANGGNGDWKTIDEDLGNFGFITFARLNANENPAKIGKTFSDLYRKARNGDDNTANFQLQNLADIHLITADGNTSALRMVQVIMLVVILLLAIASINYVNLSTARSLVRAKEVSVRKVVGAQKRHLFFQFTLETILLFCFATVLAFGLIYLLMPLYNNISGKTLSFSFFNASVWKAIGLAVVGTLLASSIYPAILLSAFKPIEALKGKYNAGIGAASFRKVLVVFQFSISVILLIWTTIMGRQMDFIKNKDLGYDKSYVFSVPLPDEVSSRQDAVKAELKNRMSILNAAISDVYNFTNIGRSTGDIGWQGKPAKSMFMITQVAADKDFVPTMRMKFIEGGNFSGTPADSASFILNETAVKKMGLKPPYVGQQISFHDKKGSIIGVVQDFNYQSLKEAVAPLIFFRFWGNGNILYVRTTAAHAQQAIAATEKEYKKYAGDTPFSYSFLDKNFEEQYKSEQRSSLLFNVFAGIAIFISCLGLFGLATYTAQVRIKEIGIRKVLGASVANIIQLLSKDFLKLVVFAIIIATPVAWWAVNKWLQGFAYRINISWWVFAVAGLLSVLIAWITISFQAFKAAISNPVKSLRTE